MNLRDLMTKADVIAASHKINIVGISSMELICMKNACEEGTREHLEFCALVSFVRFEEEANLHPNMSDDTLLYLLYNAACADMNLLGEIFK